MKVPTPDHELKGRCSVIHNNTLYVFSKNGLQYIDLEKDAKWHAPTSYTSGDPVLVDDAVCMLGGVEGNEDEQALYVVGGTGGGDFYSGLQRYSFKDTTWSTLGSVGVLTGLTGHGAGYISSSHKIVVFGGSSSGDTVPAGQTFTIETVPPYGSGSQLPQGAPNSNNPYLMAWDASNVAMMGGQTSSAAVWTFSDTTGWTTSGASLPSPSTVSDTTQPIVMDDSAGGKILMTFNMDGSADSVQSYALVNDEGKAQAATPLKRSLSDYPTYNSSYAPSKKWPEFSLAQQQGMVVVAGGSGDETLAIFNQTSNSWANATELFYGKPQHTLKHHTTTTSFTSSTPTSTSTSTSSSSASVTPTSTSSSTPAAAAGGSTSHADLKTILGATLGSVCGVAIILLLLLFLLRRKKQQQIQNGQRPNDSKDRLSFQDQGLGHDQGLAPLAAGAYPMAKSPVPFASMSNDSLAIMSGRATGEKSLKPPPNNGYGLSSKPRDSSPLSPIPSSGLAPSSMYSQSSEAAAIVAGGAAGAGAGAAVGSNKAGDRTTDEGWGKYFEDNNDTSNLGMPADRSTVSSVYTKSDYRGSAWPMTNLAPINFGFLDQPKPLGQVYSGSPTTESSSSVGIGRSLAIPEAQSARISSADSISLMSDDDPHDTAWTGAHKQSWLGRPPSSNYSTSFYNSSTRDLQNTGSGYFPDMDNRQSHGRRSSVIIPDDIDEIRTPGRTQNVNSDMSWLNIHADR
ncbi:hypothetical protein N7509_012326 [Penicillium cosmopolitanum]|uniref:Pre-mRNA splicing factor CLF1 n=1 Tax=Penicillium cosmopolitanum TaxID=1131564 RepID=A0A9W9SIP8_9EURO|nr:uncharacterized protein N7509_012326 [Penicillium cosmopolitanum]KAJ5379207.1 hypothetical protein N7509_012326 [Penicillium cosmopolitanum]